VEGSIVVNGPVPVRNQKAKRPPRITRKATRTAKIARHGRGGRTVEIRAGSGDGDSAVATRGKAGGGRKTYARQVR